MALRFRVPRPSFAFLLQTAACGVVAWSLWSGDLLAPRPAGGAAAPAAAPASTAVPGGTGAPDAGADRDSPPTAAAAAGPVGAPPAPAAPARAPILAGAPGFDGARLALSSIDVIVSRNDTLDRIFRRLKLSLADLATLRSLPGLKAHLDSLRPGESLRLTHRDGELFGLERRLNDAETLKVVRTGDALTAD